MVITFQLYLEIAPVRLEGIKDGCPIQHVRLDLVVGSCELGDQLQDLVDFILGDDDNTIHWISENEIARVYNRAIDVDRYFDCPRGTLCPCANRGESP